MVTAGASGLSCEEEDESIFVCEKDGCILLGKSTKMEVTVMVRNVIKYCHYSKYLRCCC